MKLLHDGLTNKSKFGRGEGGHNDCNNIEKVDCK